MRMNSFPYFSATVVAVSILGCELPEPSRVINQPSAVEILEYEPFVDPSEFASCSEGVEWAFDEIENLGFDVVFVEMNRGYHGLVDVAAKQVKVQNLEENEDPCFLLPMLLHERVHLLQLVEFGEPRKVPHWWAMEIIASGQSVPMLGNSMAESFHHLQHVLDSYAGSNPNENGEAYFREYVGQAIVGRWDAWNVRKLKGKSHE